jgi:hypothetical protein
MKLVALESINDLSKIAILEESGARISLSGWVWICRSVSKA